METEKICPNCRKPLPPDVPLGLCPECLIKSGFPTEADPGTGGIGRFVPPPLEEIARLFPQLEILSFIGKGGMGAVYQARQPGLDRLVALKILPPAVGGDPGFAERFNREARALARLSHPNIVVVYDFGQAGPLHYLIMEFVDGTNLRQVEQAGRLSAEQALAIVPQICEALQFAHNEGIVHRDIKPENLLLDKKGRLKITDFGIAKMLGVPAGKAALTGVRDVVGTPHYMAPEQIEKPQAVDHRADIYSLGVVFYEMLTGELPLGKFAPPSKKVQVDVRLDEVVLHTLEKEPERRYQQANQVKTDIEAIAGTTPPKIGAAAAASPAPATPPAMPPGPPAPPVSDKIILPAFLLALFFGIFGAHRFYVGKIGTGIAQLFTFGGLGIWSTIDWILILCKAFTDGQGRRITNWWHPYSGPPKPVKPPRPPAPPIAGGNPSNPSSGAFGGAIPMVAAPALAMMLAGFIKLIGGLLVLLTGWPHSSTGHFLFSRFGMFPHPFPDGPLFGVGVALFVLVPAVISIYGAAEMIRCGSYAWAVAASLVSIVFCSTLGLPAGIWALIILLLPPTRLRFENPPVSLARESWLIIFAATGAGALMLVLIMSFAGYLQSPGASASAASVSVTSARNVKDRTPTDSASSPAARPPPALPAQPAAPALPPAPAPAALPVTPASPAAPTPPPPMAAQSNQTRAAVFTVTNTPRLSYQWYPAGAAPLSNQTLAVAEFKKSPAKTASRTVLIHKVINVGEAADFSQSFDVAPGGKLSMDLDRGDVRIAAADQDTLTIQLTRNVTGAGDVEAAKILKEERVVLQQNGNDISVTSEGPPDLDHFSFFTMHRQLNVRCEITLPRRFAARVATTGGDVRVDGTLDGANIRTMGGDLDCNNLGGDVTAHTMGGDVHVTGCTGSLHLETSGGDIKIEGFTGAGLDAATSGGSVSADFVAAPAADSELRTMGGNITVRLPAHAALNVDAHTMGGSVKTDFPLRIENGFGNDSLNGQLNGGGPLLKMETSGGNIQVLKR